MRNEKKNDAKQSVNVDKDHTKMAMRQFISRLSTFSKNDVFFKNKGVRDFLKTNDVKKYLMFTAGLGGIVGGMHGFEEVSNHNFHSKDEPDRVHDMLRR